MSTQIKLWLAQGLILGAIGIVVLATILTAVL
jgi:hypothetical protein